MTLGCVIAVAGCSSQTQDRVLRVFFTGMEQPGTRAAESSSARATNTVSQPTAAPAVPPPIYVHLPYGENKCSACHIGTQSQELRPGGAAICKECHPKLADNAKYVHAPFADGDCKACHSPHQSLEPRLLIAKGQAVCTECHEPALLGKVKSHEGRENDVCWTCHDPHGSEQKGLLKASP